WIRRIRGDERRAVRSTRGLSEGRADPVMDPIHQFQITNLFTIGRIGGVEIAFTNSAVFMLIALAIIAFLMVGATASRAIVPGRMQAVAEASYEFIANTLRATAGEEGLKFFPLVFSLFMFILTVNVI